MSAKKKGPSRFKHEIWIAPNAESKKNAREALAAREVGPAKGGTDAGIKRAKSIVAGELQPAREIRGWFARHLQSLIAAEAQNKTINTSRALQSAGLWGGDSMYMQADRAVRMYNIPWG